MPKNLERAALAALITACTGAVAHAATFTVTNANDSGPGSLRDAVDQANAAMGADQIEFDPALTNQTLTLTTDDTTNPSAFGPTAFVITDTTGRPMCSCVFPVRMPARPQNIVLRMEIVVSSIELPELIPFVAG